MATFVGQDLLSEGRGSTNIGGTYPFTPADHSFAEGFGPAVATGNDFLYGGPVAADFTGVPPTDSTWGLGNDLLQGYGGSDVLHGGAGDDILFGHARPGQEANGGVDAADQLYGGAGSDWLSGYLGNDTADGGDGSDTVVLAGVQTDYTFTGTAASFTATHTATGETETILNAEFVAFSNTFTDAAKVAVTSLLPPPDTTPPTVTVNIEDTTLNDADATSQVTFSFSEAIAANTFILSDATATNGSLTNLVVAADGLSATATFTADDNVNGTGSVSVAANAFTDVAGNQNTASSTDTVAINTVDPDTTPPTVTVNIEDTTLNDADATSQVTFSFSEAIAANTFILSDATATNGSLTNLVVAADGLSATATFTADDNVNGAGSVSVAANAFTDVAGNQNTASSTDTVAINTAATPIEGGAGHDKLNGTPGNDVIDGKGGNDTLLGSAGADQMIGGPGTDTVRYTSPVVLDLLDGSKNTGQAAGDTFSSIEWFYFSNGNDKAYGDGANNKFLGGNGKDLFYGRGGHDWLHGNNGNDTLLGQDGHDKLYGGNGNDRLYGGNGHDKLYGENGHDRLFGGDGNDWLSGGNGKDWLVGGLGRDKMNGNAGADRYDFNAVEESSVGSQRDWVYLSGGDKIDVSTIDADTDTAGNQKFHWVDKQNLGASFTGQDGQLRFANGILRGDTNGDKVADFEIKVIGWLSAGDLIL